jgi:hypothetical protein
MPIQSLIRGAAFPEIGQLRKGGEKPESGKAPGKDLNYFRFTSDDPEAVAQFAATFGDKPRSIGVFLPLPSLTDNFDAWCEEYTAGAIQHRCDGVTCVGWRDKSGAWQTTPKPCPGGCKATGRLKVFIPAFKRMAFVTVLTTSKHDIVNLHSSLAALEAVNGKLQGIPLILRRVEREISTPSGNGQRARRKKWLLQIEAEPQWAALQFGAMREAALLTQGRELLMLESGDPEDDESNDAEIVGAIKQSARECGLNTPKALAAELKTINVRIDSDSGTRMHESLMSLPADSKSAVLIHLQTLAIELKQGAADDAAQPEIVQGELV